MAPAIEKHGHQNIVDVHVAPAIKRHGDSQAKEINRPRFLGNEGMTGEEKEEEVGYELETGWSLDGDMVLM